MKLAQKLLCEFVDSLTLELWLGAGSVIVTEDSFAPKVTSGNI